MFVEVGVFSCGVWVGVGVESVSCVFVCFWLNHSAPVVQ
jgi:hypothetical protein